VEWYSRWVRRGGRGSVMGKHYGSRERHKDKEHPATIKLLLLLSFTVSLSKEAGALLGKSKCIIYRNDDEAISITVSLRRLVLMYFVSLS